MKKWIWIGIIMLITLGMASKDISHSYCEGKKTEKKEKKGKKKNKPKRQKKMFAYIAIKES